MLYYEVNKNIRITLNYSGAMLKCDVGERLSQ